MKYESAPYKNFQNSILLSHIAAVKKELNLFTQLFYLLVILRKYINSKLEQNKHKNENVYVEGNANVTTTC